MPYVITRLCRDCVDGSCIPVCPASDCIVEHRPRDGQARLPNQLYINPDQCIDCGACEPECPWGAIALDDDVPPALAGDVALNALAAAHPEDYVEAAPRERPRPTPEDVEANRRHWEAAGEPLSDGRAAP
jgi:NAD-dependent dihydropyrimidine dehydrogenase PreA subunit